MAAASMQEPRRAVTNAFAGLPADPVMPGFLTALDPDAMSVIISRYVLGSAATCSRVRLARFRYRAGRRLIVVYDVIAQTGEGRSASLIVTARINPGRAPRLPAEGSDGRTAEGWRAVTCVPELDMRLDVFPEDRRLPAARLYAGNGGDAAMALLAAAGIGLRCDGHGIVLEPVRYRPGLSATFVVCKRTSDEARGQHLGFLKLAQAGEAKREADTTARVNAELVRVHAPARLTEPAAIDATNGAAFYRPARGIALDRRLVAGDATGRAALAVAQALVALHLLGPCGLPNGFGADVTTKIARAARHVTWACPDVAAAAHALTDEAVRLADGCVMAPTHRDMKPDHVFIDDASGGVEFIDSGSVCLGNPLIDVAGLAMRIGLAAQLGEISKAAAGSFCRAFLDAYFARAPASWRPYYEPACAYARLLLATHLIQRQAPGWRDHVHHLVQGAAQSRPSGP